MAKRIAFWGVLFLIGFGVNLTFAGSNMNPGKWEITIDMEMQGMPVKMPSTTVMQCMSEDNMVPDTQQPGQECTMSNIRTSGNTVTWTIECDTPGGRTNGKGSVTYTGDQMKGTMEIEMEQEGMKVISHMKGRRIGDCD